MHAGGLPGAMVCSVASRECDPDAHGADAESGSLTLSIVLFWPAWCCSSPVCGSREPFQEP